MEKIIFFWFRRDLRLDDNKALYEALNQSYKVITIFIFDSDILEKLKDKKDKRVNFIYQQLIEINQTLIKHGSSLLIKYGKPEEIWKNLLNEYDIYSVYANHDYEPSTIERDQKVQKILSTQNIPFITSKDQVIFEKEEILNNQGKPYTIYTPYKNKWLEKFEQKNLEYYPSENHIDKFFKTSPFNFISLKEIGFETNNFIEPSPVFDKNIISNYDKFRDFPAMDKTTHLGIHLRFGTISIRKAVETGKKLNAVWLSELIWREFFMMILFNFPHVVKGSFRKEYDNIKWNNDTEDFEKWCKGLTGIPIVDAGMRELNETGHMHNRVRMIVASFLTKHLLIDWRWGEKYFAEKLLDFELASNNGNWQWAAGTGCDASPYFRVFNPETQAKKFDPEGKYITKWVPESINKSYQKPLIQLDFGRERALRVYKEALGKN